MFSVVLVSYNSAHVIGDAIRSIPEGNQAIVVDNASRDDSVAVARALGAEVVELPKNLGFGTACNRGAERARFERLLFLNPDARLQPGALDALGAAFERYPAAGAFNPRILNQSGVQVFRRRTKLLPRPYLFRPPVPDRDARLVFATGAALAVRRNLFSSLGGFDEDIFLYFEDDDLSVRIQQAGWTLMYINDAVCKHAAGTSTQPSRDTLAFKEYQFMRSKIMTYRKHRILHMKNIELFILLIKRCVAKNATLNDKYDAHIKAFHDMN